MSVYVRKQSGNLLTDIFNIFLAYFAQHETELKTSCSRFEDLKKYPIVQIHKGGCTTTATP